MKYSPFWNGYFQRGYVKEALDVPKVQLSVTRIGSFFGSHYQEFEGFSQIQVGTFFVPLFLDFENMWVYSCFENAYLKKNPRRDETSADGQIDRSKGVIYAFFQTRLPNATEDYLHQLAFFDLFSYNLPLSKGASWKLLHISIELRGGPIFWILRKLRVGFCLTSDFLHFGHDLNDLWGSFDDTYFLFAKKKKSNEKKEWCGGEFWMEIEALHKSFKNRDGLYEREICWKTKQMLCDPVANPFYEQEGFCT